VSIGLGSSFLPLNLSPVDWVHEVCYLFMFVYVCMCVCFGVSICVLAFPSKSLLNNIELG